MWISVHQCVSWMRSSGFCYYSLIQNQKAPKTRTSISWDGCEYQNITWIAIKGLLVFMAMCLCVCEGTEKSCSCSQRTGKSFILCYTTKFPLQSHAKAPVLLDLNAIFHASQWITLTVMATIRLTSKGLLTPSCCLWKRKDPTFLKKSVVKAAVLYTHIWQK